jgi:hypothetical protein
MMARSTNAPCKGRIRMRETNPLHLFRFGLQRTASSLGPHVRFRRVQTLVREGSPLVKLRNSA